MDPIEDTSMAPSIVRGFMTWWEIVQSTLLGMDDDYDKDEYGSEFRGVFK